MNVMTGAALKAGRGLKRDFGEVENLQVSVKGPGDFVTAADKKAEKTLFEELSKARPGYGFIMEEGGAFREAAVYREVFTGSWKPNNEYWEVPETPGLGVGLSPEFLREHKAA